MKFPLSAPLLTPIFLLISCSPISNSTATPTIQTLTESAVPSITSTETISPTTTVPATELSTSESTTIASPTPSQTLLPTSTPSPFPWSDQTITLETIDLVKQLGVWGKGAIEAMDPFDNGAKIAVRTLFGVYLYDTKDFTLLKYFEDAIIYQVSPSTMDIAIGFPWGLVELLDASTLERIHRFEHQAQEPNYPPPGFHINDLLFIRSMAFSPDEGIIVVGYGDNQIEIYQTRDGNLINVLEALIAPEPNALFFSPDGNYLFSDNESKNRTYNNKVAIWSMENGELISLINSAGRFGEFRFHPDGTTLAASQFGGYILVYSLPDGELVGTFGTGEYFPTVDFSKDGDYLLVNGGQQVRRVQDGKQVTGVDPSELKRDQLVTLVVPEEQKWSLGHFQGLNRIEYDQSKFHLWGSFGMLIYRWNVDTDEVNAYDLDPSVQWVDDLAVSPQGDIAAACADVGASYKTLFRVSLREGESSTIGRCLGELAFTSGGEFIVKNNRGFADILDSESGELVKNILYHYIKGFSADGNYLFTERNDRVAFVWRSDVSKSFKLMDNPPKMEGQLAVSPDERHAVINGDKLYFWRLTDGWEVKTVPIDASSLVISTDGTILAVGGPSGQIHLLSIPSGEALMILEGHRDTVVDLAFTADGKNLISASLDGTVRLWGVRD